MNTFLRANAVKTSPLNTFSAISLPADSTPPDSAHVAEPAGLLVENAAMLFISYV
jgi:hypothetical protein